MHCACPFSHAHFGPFSSARIDMPDSCPFTHACFLFPAADLPWYQHPWCGLPEQLGMELHGTAWAWAVAAPMCRTLAVALLAVHPGVCLCLISCMYPVTQEHTPESAYYDTPPSLLCKAAPLTASGLPSACILHDSVAPALDSQPCANLDVAWHALEVGFITYISCVRWLSGLII